MRSYAIGDFLWPSYFLVCIQYFFASLILFVWRDGHSALSHACTKKSEPIIRLLLDAKADVNAKHSWYPRFPRAFWNGNMCTSLNSTFPHSFHFAGTVRHYWWMLVKKGQSRSLSSCLTLGLIARNYLGGLLCYEQPNSFILTFYIFSTCWTASYTWYCRQDQTAFSLAANQRIKELILAHTMGISPAAAKSALASCSGKKRK